MVFLELKFGGGRGGKQPKNVDDSERADIWNDSDGRLLTGSEGGINVDDSERH